jgi:hypothetical protein
MKLVSGVCAVAGSAVTGAESAGVKLCYPDS